jgi:hypothetical protein
VPPAVEAVIRRCLEKSRDHRYPSVAELLEDLGPTGSLPEGVRHERVPESLRDSQLPEVVVPLDELPVIVPAQAASQATPAPRSVARVAPASTASQSQGQGRNWLILLAGIAAIGAVVWFALPKAGLTGQQARAGNAAQGARPAPSAAPAPARAETEVHLVLSPLDAQVFFGEQNLGQMPVSVKVEDGKPLVVTVRRKGYKTRRVVLDGSSNRVVVGLNKLPSSSK